jgi:hypothetical protein
MSVSFVDEFQKKIHWKFYFDREEVEFEILKKFIFKTNYKNIEKFKLSHLSNAEKEELKK